MAILVTGGARSGKSGFAEQYAKRTASGAGGLYIATCQAYDDEMVDRIHRHQTDREDSGFHWETIEEPFKAAELLMELAIRYNEDRRTASANEQSWSPPVVLMDCLTLWLTNWMLRLEGESDEAERLTEEVSRLVRAIEQYPHPLLVVTNEVGDGIVPTYALGRRFRDEAGRLNQRVAAVSERVFLVTAGIPVDVKAIAFRWEEL